MTNRQRGDCAWLLRGALTNPPRMGYYASFLRDESGFFRPVSETLGYLCVHTGEGRAAGPFSFFRTCGMQQIETELIS